MNRIEYDEKTRLLFQELAEWMIVKSRDGFSVAAIGDALISRAGVEVEFRVATRVKHGLHETWELARDEEVSLFSSYLDQVREQVKEAGL